MLTLISSSGLKRRHFGRISNSEPKKVTFKLSEDLEVSILMIYRQNRMTWIKFRRLAYQQQPFSELQIQNTHSFLGSSNIVLSVFFAVFKPSTA